MAYIRSASTRTSLLRRRCFPSFSFVLRDDGDDHCKPNSIIDGGQTQRLGSSNYIHHRSFGTNFNNSANAGFGGLLRNTTSCLYFTFQLSPGTPFVHYMSTAVGGALDKIDVAEALSDTTDVLVDAAVQTVATQAPAANEVAIAAADSFFPVAALQHFIDAVHSFTGLNWWASIILTTLLIRGATVPLLINQLKATSKLSIMRPRLDEIKQRTQDKGMDPYAVAEGQKEVQKLFKEYGMSPFSPLKGVFIQGSVFISFFFAISNMAEKVPSFKSGGAYWFIDLSTPDSLYIFPVLTALTFWVTVEGNMQEGMEGNPAAGTMKDVSRVLAAAFVPLTMSFPKAIFCYWLTSNVFSIVYGLVLKAPGVKKTLGVLDLPVQPQTTSSQPSFNLLSALTQVAAARQQRLASSSVEPSSKVVEKKISSSSVIRQRLRSLEKQVKGRKKNRKS